MRPDDLLIEEDELGIRFPRPRLDMEFLSTVRQGPIEECDDIEISVALARLIHDDLESFGTGGGEQLNNDEMRGALRTLHVLTDRLGITEIEIPFRDFTAFKSWWLKKGAYNSWQARRDLLEELFEPIHRHLEKLEDASLESTLSESISPHSRTGWARVDTEISELRRHFRNAITAQDYRAVGLDCVAVIEALSRQVYDPEIHLRPGEVEPPVVNTKQRLDRFVQDAAGGSGNAAIRKVAKAVIELAQEVKHRDTPTRREAGIAADAVIQLANILRRLQEPV